MAEDPTGAPGGGGAPSAAPGERSRAALEEENALLRRERDAARGDAALGGVILAAATDYAIITADPRGRVTSWNAGASNLLGWREADAVGMDVRLLFTPEDRAAGLPEAKMAEALARGRAEHECWHLRRDGSRLWASGLILPLRDGPAPGFLKILRDRTAERRTAEALAERDRRLSALAQASSRIAAAAPDLEATFREITDAARAIVGARRGAAGLTRGPPPGRVDEDGHPAGRPPAPARGRLVAPLVTRDGRDLGLIELSDRADGGEFDEADEAVLAQLARFASVAVEQAQADAALRERNARLEFLAEAAAVLISGDDPGAAVAALFRSIGERLDVDACFSFSADEAAGELRLEDHAGLSEEDARGLARIRFGQAVCGVVAQTRLPAHAAGVQASDDPLTAYVRRLGVSAYASFPLVAGGRLLGTLSFGSRRRDRFGEEELALFRTVAHHVAAARERARAEAALRGSEARFREFAEATDDVLWIIDAGTMRLEYLSPAYEKVWGEPRGPVLADTARWSALVHPDDRERARLGLPTILRGDAFEQEYRIVRASDGAVRWIRDKGFAVRGPDGRVRRVAGLARDVTARREADRRQAVLLQELAHRVKNTLAMVLAMAQQTGLRAADLDGFLDAFEGRVRALAAAHDLLTESGWRSTPLPALVGAALAAHEERPGDGRIRVDVAADVTLTPAAAQSLVLALHELATNATKHGALSAPGGRVGLEGRVEGGDVVLAWRESGGPAVAAAPAEAGFGTALLRQVVTYQHDGRIEFDWRPEGLACTLRLPLAEVAGRAGSGSV